MVTTISAGPQAEAVISKLKLSKRNLHLIFKLHASYLETEESEGTSVEK
jgi:hypothetical protein|tara:strand:+ start:829 stop:975 length:147 start_codon:yes stop_codon:yes gene_type:complete